MPVVDVIVATARSLLGCWRTVFFRREGDELAAMRHRHGRRCGAGLLGRIPVDAAHNFPSKVLLSRKPLHIPDWMASDLPEHEKEIQRRTAHAVGAARAAAARPRPGALGVLIFQREVVQAFNEIEVALAQSFADRP